MTTRPMYYRLNENREPIAMDHNDYVSWASRAYTTADGFEKERRVAKTQVDGDCEVSTVFLGIDHGFTGDGPPVLFESLVFGGDLDGECERYCTWQEAEEGHAAMVARCLS